MKINSAVLIQDIREFHFLVYPVVHTQVVKLGLEHPTLNLNELAGEALLWIIQEKLETIKHLYAVNHAHNYATYARVMRNVEEHIDLEKLFGRYIQGPPIYGDNNQVEVVLEHGDLYIFYRRSQYLIDLLTDFKGYDANNDFRRPSIRGAT